MKRISKAILLSFVAILIGTLPVLAAVVYRAAYTIVEADGNAYDMLAVLEAADNEWMADNGFIQPDALDTRIETLGGLNKPHMVAENKTLTAVPVPANSQTNLYFTTANSVLSSLDIITGNDGYVTIDADATLELGSDFEIEQSGYVDTTGGADVNLVFKEDAFRTYISAEDEITSAVRWGEVFPVVETESGGFHDVDQVNHIVTLPAGIESGDLLLAFFTADGDAPNITFPNEGTDWIQLYETPNGANVRAGAWYRIADGSEGANITVVTGNAQHSSYTVYRISGYSGVPEAGTPVVGGAAAGPDPPNLAPSWGAVTVSTLWFVGVGNNNTQTVNVYPANYTDGRNDVGVVGGSSCGTGSARRELRAASDNPGVFTLSGAEEWVVCTVAIAPADLEVIATGIASGEYTVTTGILWR